MKSYTRFFKETVSVTMIKQYTYCPMIPWIINYFNYQPESTASMDSGKAKATPELKKKIAEKLGLPKPYLIEYPIEYKPLRIKGIVDVIAGGKRLYVLEVKVYKRSRKMLNHFMTQLITYAYIVEKTLGPVRAAILYNGGDVIRIRPTLRDYKRIEKIVKDLIKTINSEEPPKIRQNPKKCDYCEYKRLCPNYY